MIPRAALALLLLAACAPVQGDPPEETDTDTAEDTAGPWAPCGGPCACIGAALVESCPEAPPAAPCDGEKVGLFYGYWLQECGTAEDLWGTP